MNIQRENLIEESEITSLIRRMELMPSILERKIEEEIIELVQLPESWYVNALEDFLNRKKLTKDGLKTWLENKGWLQEDLNLFLARPEALFRFSKQRFGPGLEENYLSSAADLDIVIYCLIRVRDSMLANELWMRLCEKEANFVDIASHYGEGPEADRKGLIGPIAFGTLQPPKVRDLLRALAPGEFTSPHNIGGWNILMKLEKIMPSSLDNSTRDKLLKDQLTEFIKNRSIALLNKEPVEPLHYDQ